MSRLSNEKNIKVLDSGVQNEKEFVWISESQTKIIQRDRPLQYLELKQVETLGSYTIEKRYRIFIDLN